MSFFCARFFSICQIKGGNLETYYGIIDSFNDSSATLFLISYKFESIGSNEIKGIEVSKFKGKCSEGRTHATIGNFIQNTKFTFPMITKNIVIIL